MGWIISKLKNILESYGSNNKYFLKAGGSIITLTLISISGFIGWSIEQLSFSDNNNHISLISSITLILLLSSSIASRSLINSVLEVIKFTDKDSKQFNIKKSREKLSYIVGRDVENLNNKDILRAVAETASENSVDGIFAPIFWMVIGIFCWEFSNKLPGPLTLALIFKASSTLDSMIGYKEENLKWIGFSAAKLDDLMTWIPCRLVLITVPLVTRPWYLAPQLIRNSWIDGSKDESPNSGISEAIFAYCLKIRMGGVNTYKNKKVKKPIIAKYEGNADNQSIKKIIKAILKLEVLWIALIVLINYIIDN